MEGTTLPNETPEEIEVREAAKALEEAKGARRKLVQQSVKESLASLESEYGLKLLLVAFDPEEDRMAMWKSEDVSTLELEGLRSTARP